MSFEDLYASRRGKPNDQFQGRLDPIANETRRETRPCVGDARVLLCGLADIGGRHIAVKRSVLEAHTAAAANDADLTVTLFRNCHAHVTEGYRDAGVPLNRPARPCCIRSWRSCARSARCWSKLARNPARWRGELVRADSRLDRDCPNWRAMDEAAA